jgi:hypothetical protein
LNSDSADNTEAAPATPPALKRRFSIGLPWVIIALVGFVAYALFNRQVFPAASINYALTSKEAALQARSLATALGYDLNKTIQTTIFLDDDEAKTVLEFNLGINAANQLMKNDVPVWLWRTRFCKELSQEQLYIAFTTSGQLKSVFHKLENDLKLPSLSKEEAEHLAESFVEKFGKQDLSKYELFDYGTEVKPNRVDQHFEWRKGGYPESTLRIRVEIAGNKVSTYRYYLAPSDTWTRKYKKIRENNELLGKIASFFIFVFIVTTIGAFVYGLNTHNIRWRFALVGSLIVVLLVILDQGNNWTNTVDSQYETKLTFANFVTNQMMLLLMATVGSFLISMLLIGGAEIIYRRAWPAHMAMPYLLSPKGLSQSDFFQKTIYGYLIVGGMMLWVIAYYMVGQQFNFFCPLGVDDYKTVGTLCPAISAALIGVSAAGLEELTCRVVALGLLKRVLKNFWLANLIQAVIWGFAHSQYPQQPSYARGVELSVVGLVFGWIINRYGLVPCFVAHYLYDAFLTVEPVFPTHQLQLIIPAIICLLPFLLGSFICQRWAGKNGVIEVDLSNKASEVPLVPKEKVEVEIDRSETKYQPLSTRSRVMLLVTALLCLSVTFIPSSQPVGAEKKVLIDARQALTLAKRYLHEDAIVDAGYDSEVELIAKPDQSDLMKWQYIFEQLGKAQTSELYTQTEPCLEWRVRFYKPQESKVYWVFMNADGRKRATVLENIDEGKGARLTEPEALAVVDAYLKKNRPEFLPYKVIGGNKIVRPDRVDYEFELNVPKFNVGATASKVKAGIKGNEISEFKIDYDLPDAWTWPRSKQKWYQQLDTVSRYVFGIVLLVAALYWIIHVLRATSIRWAGPLVFGVVGLIASVLSTVNNVPKLFFNYNTAEDINSFVAQSFAQESLKVLLISFGYLLLALAGFATIRLCFPAIANQLRHGFLLKPHNKYERVMRSDIYLDAVVGSYALCMVFTVVKMLQSFLMEPFTPSIRLDIPRFMPAIFSSMYPPLDIVTAVLSGVILSLTLLSIGAALWQKFLATRVRGAIFVLVCGALMGAAQWFWQDCLSGFAFTVLYLSAALFFITRVFKSNLLSYVFIILELTAGIRISELIEHGLSIAQAEIALSIAFLCLPLLATVGVLIEDKFCQHSESN